MSDRIDHPLDRIPVERPGRDYSGYAAHGRFGSKLLLEAT
jgi:hypothetical protein